MYVIMCHYVCYPVSPGGNTIAGVGGDRVADYRDRLSLGAPVTFSVVLLVINFVLTYLLTML